MVIHKKLLSNTFNEIEHIDLSLQKTCCDCNGEFICSLFSEENSFISLQFFSDDDDFEDDVDGLDDEEGFGNEEYYPEEDSRAPARPCRTGNAQR